MIRLKRALHRSVNRGLAIAGLKLTPLSDDGDALAEDDYALTFMATRLAGLLAEWLTKQSAVPINGSVVTPADIRAFFELWRNSPYRTDAGGSRFNNLCALFALSKAYQPEIIIDSGTYQGASIWALTRGCSSAKAWSFDIDLSAILKRLPDVTYQERDWTEANLDLAGMRSLLYFDDHVDQVRRLIEAQAAGGAVAVFDDDFNVFSFARMAPSADVLPKVEFALDPGLPNGYELRWMYRGRRLVYSVDRDYLDRGRAAIAATDRIVDTSLATGIQQTPYRVVRLASPSDQSP